MSESVDVPIARIHPDAKLPTQGSALAAGFDLYCVERVEVEKGTTEMLPTGLALAIPPGWEGQIRCRSGLGKKGLILPNGVGTIDADYRGELKVLAHWIGEGQSYVVEKGERIGQLLLKRVPNVNFIEVERGQLDETARGDGGFGGSGRF
ncbi:MAG: dUTP diphosphatase [Candidatus Thalassarchaeaceae archaeon]|jgi:dUTP pyrophosphatase|nr:dUTP diphosphatase [Candidatus Thalassarchaeaceae archaeon]